MGGAHPYGVRLPTAVILCGFAACLSVSKASEGSNANYSIFAVVISASEALLVNEIPPMKHGVTEGVLAVARVFVNRVGDGETPSVPPVCFIGGITWSMKRL